MRRVTNWRRMVGLVALGATLAGCAGAREDAALEAYRGQDYRRAIELSEPGARSSERSALIAGLAAQAAGDQTQAVRWLAPLRESADPAIRGRALAGLGLVAMAEERHADAADYLHGAAESLGGPEAARAMLLAGDASLEAGAEGQARSYYQIAQVRAGGAEPISGEIASRLGDSSAPATAVEPPEPSGD
ncbi:MAG: hypothetical protein ACF8R7_07425 [Phycisphaerales bacterium JB039]